MALLTDLFGPKWRHSDPGKRLKAIDAIRDQQLLFTIATNDASLAVRQKAVGSLSDRSSLEKVLNGEFDASLKIAAARGLEDDGPILEALRSDLNSNMGLPSVACFGYLESLKFEASLLVVLGDGRFNESLRRKAAQLLKDEANVLACAREASYPLGVRKAAIERLSDQESIKLLAESDADPEIRACATTCIRLPWSMVNTDSTSFPALTLDGERLSKRFGGCKDCKTVYALEDAVQYQADWDNNWAHYYFCPKCNPRPNPRGTENWYDGNIVGLGGKQIIDQVRKSQGDY